MTRMYRLARCRLESMLLCSMLSTWVSSVPEGRSGPTKTTANGGLRRLPSSRER